jgi:penicillin amidase
VVTLPVWLWLAACKKDEVPPAPPGDTPSPLLGVEELEDWGIEGMASDAYVMRTEGSVPYIYAESRPDLARVVGFVVARDRYFEVDMIRRLAQGRVSELLGDPGLSSDQESRGIGMTRTTDRMLGLIEANPEWTSIMDGYAAGVNAYVDAVKEGQLPVPSEYATLGPVLGKPDPREMLTPFERRDLAAVAATLIYNLGFETTDVGRAAAWDAIPGLFEGAPLGEQRQAGVVDDVLLRVEPVYPISSAPGWGLSARARSRTAAPPSSGGHTRVPRPVLDRLAARMKRVEDRFGHDRGSGFGSNAWAVAGSASADGRSLLAGDGHLGMSIPPLFYSVGMDTQHLGGGDIHQVGLMLPGFPTLAVGTNGAVAWSQTQLFGDITDWYAEQIVLDAQGVPQATRFLGEDVPLVAIPETYTIASVPLLGSVGRTETWTRWETPDGRLLAEVEGVVDGTPGPGQSLIDVQGTRIVPMDIDGDGIISGVSFDYTAFDDGNLLLASEGFGQAQDVFEFREATRKLVAYSQNIVASDKNGDILYTGYQAVPCRDYLPRDPDGSFAEGADPTKLIDGTTYSGFTIPVDPVTGLVDESQGSDPYRCVVPFEAYPQSTSPESGYVLTANNDIGNISTDGDLYDDPYYIGGAWLEGYRAKRIDEVLADEAAAKTADIASMSRLQGDHHSTTAEQLLPILLESFEVARAISEPEPGSSEERIAALWAANEARFSEVEQRLADWQAQGLAARAGVETFYMSVEPGDLEASVATMLWAAWSGEFVAQVFDDEGFPGVWYPTGDTGKTRTLTRMLAGRGPDNPEQMASWVEETGESAFFDVLSTAELETSHEVVLLSLQSALDALTAPQTAPGEGGFGTADMSQWLWGYRHLAKFESLLGELLSADDEFGFLVEMFSVTPETLPLAEGLSPSDPRAQLPWFPRHGDHLNVDAGNPGFTREEWMYGSGPVFRMVIALGPDGAEGVNVLPGGQSGVKESPYWADQAALWLGNQTLPMHMDVSSVIGASTGRETFRAP